MYLSDHYGGADIIRNYVQSGLAGIEGVNAALAAFGHSENFYDVYHDWRLANLIRSGSGKYNYKSIDLNDYDPIAVHTEVGLPVPLKMGTDYGNTYTTLGYDTGISMVGTFGSDYIEFTNWGKTGLISFNGDEGAFVPGWEMVDGEWYSGAQDLLNTLIATEVYVDPADPTLNLTTYWDIEDFWDFGFVQVSTDGGEWDSTWTSLENEYTTYDHDPDAIITAVENLPGLTSWSGFITEDGIVTMTFDLSAYAGETIHLGFRYVTDWGTLYEGWYLLEAAVDGTDILSTLDYVYPAVEWMVTLVYEISTPWFTIYTTRDMTLNDMNEGTIFAFSKYGVKAILVVSPTMERGFADYAFEAN